MWGHITDEGVYGLDERGDLNDQESCMQDPYKTEVHVVRMTKKGTRQAG